MVELDGGTIEFAGIDYPALGTYQDDMPGGARPVRLAAVKWRVRARGVVFDVPVLLDRAEAPPTKMVEASLKELHRTLQLALDYAGKIQLKPSSARG
jgi:hypothetical protein